MKEIRPSQRFTGYFEILDHPELAENMPFVAQLEPEAWFVKKYSDAYKAPIKSRAPQAYDVLALIAHAYKGKKSKMSGKDLVAQLTHTKNFPGASGVLNAHGTRSIEMNCVWKKVKDGKFTLYK